MDILDTLTMQAETLADMHAWWDTPDADLVGSNDGHIVLISRHAGAVRKLAYQKTAASDTEREDALQAAILGFLAAMDTFDPELGQPLGHAWNYMVRELGEANREASSRPATSDDHIRFWRAMKACDNDPVAARTWSSYQRLTGIQLQEHADAGDLIAVDILDSRIAKWERKDLDVTEMLHAEASRGRGLAPDVFDAVYAALTYVRLDEHVADDSAAPTTVHETAADPNAHRAQETAEQRVAVAQLLGGLEDRERSVVSAFYGVGGAPAHTALEVAAAHGLSRTRVLGIRRTAIKKLQKLSEVA